MSCTDEIFSPDSLICTEGQDTSSCLTKSEADTLSKLYQGPVLQNGRRLTYGLSKGAENAGDWQFWLFQGPDKGPPMNVVMGTAGLRAMMNDPEYNIMDFDLERDGHLIEERAKLRDVMDVDMTDFKRSGGKLLVYQGWNDAIVRPLVTINYFDQVAAESGDVNQFMRLFMMPGVTHCRRGPGPDSADFLATVVDWVEKGRAPNSIIASKQSKEGKVLRTRPICAYPMYAEYKGMGSIDRAENFQCSNP